MPKGTIIRPAQWDALVKALADTGSTRLACEASGIARSTFYHRKANDPEFEARVQDAYDDAFDRVEEELYRRAVHGFEEPVYQAGQLVGTKLRYSDTAAIFMLKGARPEKYADRQQVRGAGENGEHVFKWQES